MLVEQDKVLRDWEPSVTRLTRIPVHEELRKYGLADDGGPHREVKVLSDFFDVKAVQIAAGEAAASTQKFERDVVELGATIEDVVGQTTALKGEIQKARGAKSGDVEETLKMLLAEIDVVVRKVRTDHEYVYSLQGPKAISTASKRAYASTTEYLPGLVNTVTDIGRLLQQVVQHKVASPKYLSKPQSLTREPEHNHRPLHPPPSGHRAHPANLCPNQPSNCRSRHRLPRRRPKLPSPIPHHRLPQHLRLTAHGVRSPP